MRRCTSLWVVMWGQLQGHVDKGAMPHKPDGVSEPCCNPLGGGLPHGEDESARVTTIL